MQNGVCTQTISVESYYLSKELQAFRSEMREIAYALELVTAHIDYLSNKFFKNSDKWSDRVG